MDKQKVKDSLEAIQDWVNTVENDTSQDPRALSQTKDQAKLCKLNVEQLINEIKDEAGIP